MAKVTTWVAPENFSGFVKDLVKAIGHKAGKADVIEKARELHGEGAVSFLNGQKNLSVAINNANKFAGYSEGATAKGSKTTAQSSVPTLEDMYSAQDLLQTLDMKPEALKKIIAELKGVGNITTIESCLDGIIKIRSAK